MRIQKPSHRKKKLFFLPPNHTCTRAFNYIAWIHTPKSRDSQAHTRTRFYRSGRVTACFAVAQRAIEENENDHFLEVFFFFFFVLPGNSVRMLPAFRQGMRPFPGMHLSCALFLDRISTWWAREIVRRSLFSCTFFTWHASLRRSGLSVNLTLPIKNFVLLFYG